MIISLFQLVEGKVVPTEICYTSKTLKEVMRVYKKDRNYMKVFSFLFFKHCPDKERNPYVNIPEHEKEALLLKECEIDFSIDEEAFDKADAFIEKLFTTPTRRFYLDSKVGLEKMGKYLRDAPIVAGRDGNDTAFLSVIKSVGKINAEFIQVAKAYDAEVKSAIRGGGEGSYDEDN